MSSAEIKIELFRKLDQLDGEKLNEVSGVLLNYLNRRTEIDEWEMLSTARKNGILKGIKELDAGIGQSHEGVINHFRNKYLSD